MLQMSCPPERVGFGVFKGIFLQNLFFPTPIRVLGHVFIITFYKITIFFYLQDIIYVRSY